MKRIICSILLAASLLGAPGIAEALPSQIVNGSFDYPWKSPRLDGAPNESRFRFCYVAPDGRYYTMNNDILYGRFNGFDRNAFGWTSNDRMDENSPGEIKLSNIVELQKDKHGNVYAELVSENAGKHIYQDVATVPGAVYRWSLRHASIYGDHTDKMSVLIGAPGKETAQQATRTSTNGSGDKKGPVGTVIATTPPDGRSSTTTGSGAPGGTSTIDTSGLWESYEGVYLVPEGQTTTRFTFADVEGYDVDSGNFVDDIEFEVAYPVTYDVNGGKGSVPDPAADNYSGYHVEGSKVAVNAPSPQREGCTFLGWSEKKLEPVTSKDQADKAGVTTSVTMKDSAVTLHAVWAKNPTVTFTDGNGGSVIATQKVSFGSGAEAPSDPEKTGYTFKGWHGSFDKVYSDTTVEATWRANRYTIGFDANGGDGSMDDMAMTYDKAKSLTPNSFTKTGYTFTGWNAEKDGSGKAYSDEQEAKNLTATDGARVVLHAQWRPNEYTVVFDANDGDAVGDMGEQEFRYDAAQALRACGYELEGHTFTGWGTSPEGGRIDYSDQQVVKNLTAEDGGEVVLYAQWSIDTYPVVFTDGMGGELSRDEVPHKTSAKAPDEPVRTGYTFDGWDADFSRVTAPMTVNATWRANRYAVAFDANGGRGHMDDQEFAYDEAQELSGNAYRRAGYSFQGWSLDDDGAIAYTDRQTVKNLVSEDGGKVTLHAVWDEDADVVVSYTVSDPDHAELSNDSDELAPATGKPKGSTVTPAEGYRFDGWVDVSTGEKVGASQEFTPSRGTDGLWHAATYEARIAPISYTVAFDANGGEGSMDGQAFAYDEAKALDGCAFERTGYAFAGWATEPDGDVAYDDAEVVSALASEDGATVTLYAVWVENPDVTIGYIADDPEHSTPSVSSETVAPATGEAKGSSLAVADGYAFDRWEDWAGAVVSEDPIIVPERGGKGLWRTSEYTAFVAPISYTVAFDANGGTGKMDDQQMTYDAAQALRKNAFERPGYIFLGWNTASDGSGTPFEDAQEVVNLTSEEGGKVVLYAQWAKRTLAVTFYDGQGHIIETDTVPYGGKATAPSEPVRDGYAFVGWDTDFGCVTKDIDVTAMWKPVSDAAIAAEAASGSSAGSASGGAPRATTPLDQTGGPGLALGFAAAALAAGAGSAFALRRKRACDGRDER